MKAALPRPVHPNSSQTRTEALLEWLRQRWRRSRLTSLTVVSGVIFLLLQAPRLWGRAPSGWSSLWQWFFYVCLFLLLSRGIVRLTSRTLWSLRNRLLVAYVFVAVVPILLILSMVGIGLYMFYGQYAAYLLVNDIAERTHMVGAINHLTAMELQRRPAHSVDQAEWVSQHFTTYYFPKGGVESYFYDGQGKPLSPNSPYLPGWLKPGFEGVVAEPDGYYIAAYRMDSAAASPRQILTFYALNDPVMQELAQHLGQVHMRLAWVDQSNPNKQGNSITVSTGTGKAAASPSGAAPQEAPSIIVASHAPLPPPTSRFDVNIRAWAFIPVVNWQTGTTGQLVLASISTRPSILNDRLFTTLQFENTRLSRLPLTILAIVGFIFFIIEIFSLLAGVRMTRTITRAVNDLYVGTQHVNRGDFDHRIPIRSRDQLAALEDSFNTMTSSIQRLLEEQRQKQRLENELAIAHEVQTQLFPRSAPRLPGIEIHGRCLPARMVSGDYYDFIELSDQRVGIAMGDISGKGISAALLMATIGSAVRAYQPLSSTLREDAALFWRGRSTPEEASARSEGTLALATTQDQLSPSALMARLNDQLYHSTPPEKYATLFYAVYDMRTHTLCYTNAGHLPPAVIGRQGRRRLDAGGMVVGLFPGAQFEEDTVSLEPGDLLVAWSDGITEPENEYGVEFGEERLMQIVEANRTRSLQEICDVVLHAVQNWSGADEQPDDVTLVLARVV